MISVVVPVYNVEKYIERCIHSLLIQEYKDFEILLIDDGSTDSSGELCERIAEQDKRIRVFHKKNGGLSDARNFGLNQLRGEYVTFIDSDDYVGPRYLQDLFEMSEKYHTDISVVRMESVDREDLFFLESSGTVTYFDKENSFKEMILGRMFGVSACGKLFRTSLFNQIRFPKGKLYEDLLTIPHIFEAGNGCAYNSSVQYYYYQRSDSIMHAISSDSIEQWNRGIDLLYSYTDRYYPAFNECVICRYLDYAFPTVINNLVNDSDYVSKIRSFMDYKKEWWRTGKSNSYLPPKQRLRIGIINLSIPLYKMLYILNEKKKRLAAGK